MADSTAVTGAGDLSRVTSLSDAKSLVNKVREIRNARVKPERDWKLNMAFYRGNQWVWFNRFSGQVLPLPNADNGDGPRYRVRLTSNQILPGVQAYIAMLTKTKPVISATPDSGAERDIKAAQMAEQLFEHWWRELHLKAKLQEALLWSVIGSAGYWKITWDPFAGKSMTFMVGQDGQPILDQTLADLFRQNLEQQGIDPSKFEKTVYMGDIRVDVIPPHMMYLDPAAPSFSEADWFICKHPMSPDEIQMRYGQKLDADASMTSYDIPDPLTGGSTTSPAKTVKDVYIGYFKPSAILPKGRYVVFVESPDKILYDGPWPFPLQELPAVEFPGPRAPGSTLNEALVTHARPLQKELNRTLSQIVMHKNLTLKPQLLAAQGQLAQRPTDEPGAVLEFMPINGVVPQWREMPSIPPYVFEHLRDIQGRLDRLFNLGAVTRGDVPPNVEAGIAIDLLQEAAVDQVSPVIQALEDGLARAGDIMAALAQKFYTEPRLMKIIGPGGVTKVRRFLNSDLEGGFSFYAEAGSGLPRTRAGRQARIESLIQMGVLRPDQAWKHLDVADMKGVAALYAADEDMAYREHDKILNGAPVNIGAFQNAMSAVQQGLNPQTGQPLGPNDNPQQLIQDAGLQPLPYEGFEQHLETHSLYMKSVEFETLPPDVQERFVTHYEQTLQYYLSLPTKPEPQAVRTTMQLKGTVDPNTAAKILFRGGVTEANAQDLSQPPLDTWVTDDLSKPNEQASGNTPLDQLGQIQTLQHQEEAHQLQQAKTAAEIALVKKRTEVHGRPAPKKAP